MNFKADSTPPGQPVRLTIAASHPIQYQTPWFRELTKRDDIDLVVLFCFQPDADEQGAGFGKQFSWDIPLLDGYRSKFLPSRHAPSLLSKRLPDAFRRYLSDPSGILLENNSDVLMVLGWHSLPLIQLTRAAARSGIPVLMRGESNDLKPRSMASMLLQKWLFRRCDRFIAIGSANQRLYESYGIPSSAIHKAGYCVENERFITQAKEHQQSIQLWRQQQGIKPDQIVFCFAGKFEPKKRVMDFLQAFELASKRNKQLVALLIGDGPLRDAAQRYSHENNLQTVFTGFLNQTEITAAYTAADVFTLPSDAGETWGLVVNETMLCGLPALVSKSAGCSEDLVIEGKTGFSFELGDIETLSKLISTIAESPAEIERMGKAAKDHVVANYNYHNLTKALVTAIDSVS